MIKFTRTANKIYQDWWPSLLPGFITDYQDKRHVSLSGNILSFLILSYFSWSFYCLLSAEYVYIQGGALNRGLIRFFSIYRPPCHIEAYIRPEKNCFVWAGPLAMHPFNFNFIFLSDGTTAAAERAVCFADLHRGFPVLFRSDGRT